MKIKPVFIYLGAFIIVIILLVITSSGGKTSTPEPQVSEESTMPQDDIHQNLGKAPGTGNVSSEFKQKMEKLKSEYESNPKDTVNSKEYARLLAAAHKPAEALDVYKSILAVNSNRNDIRIELATVYYNLGQFNDAKNEIESVLKQQPDSPDILYNLGAVEAAMGNMQRAKEIWEKVKTDYPGTEAARIAETSLQN